MLILVGKIVCNETNAAFAGALATLLLDGRIDTYAVVFPEFTKLSQEVPISAANFKDGLFVQVVPIDQSVYEVLDVAAKSTGMCQ